MTTTFCCCGPRHAEPAHRLGADLVIDPGDGEAANGIRELTTNEGVNKALDCSGSPAAQRLLIDSVRACGSIAFVGEGGRVDLDTSRDLIRTGITPTARGTTTLGHVHRLLQLIRRVPRQIDTLITHRFALSEVSEAWELQLTGCLRQGAAAALAGGDEDARRHPMRDPRLVT